MIRIDGKGLLLTGLFLAAAGASGCGREEELQTETSQAQGDSIVVGFSQLGSESDWRSAYTKSIEEAFTEENGYTLVFDNGRQRQENQLKAVRNFILQEVDYILLSPVVETGWDSVLQEAKDAGIPVLVADREVDVEDESLYTAWVGSDFKAEGTAMGQWLESYLEEQGRENEEINIVILQGTLGSSAEIGRTEGFEEIASQHPNWNILAKETGEFTTAKGREVMEAFLDRYADIDVLVSQNDDMTFGALEAMDEDGRTYGTEGEITVLSFDAVSAAFDLMEEGKINADHECNPIQGPLLSELIKKLEAGETIEKAYYVEEQIFTPENASANRQERMY